jgi:hypothetical protein
LSVSPLEVSSHRPLSPAYEHDGPSEGILVVDLSSQEEDAFPDTSWDEEFARQLFGNLNRGHLGPPNDSNVIILSDSDEEEEVCEEDTTDDKAAGPSAMKSPPPTVSTADADDASEGMQDDNSDGGDETGCRGLVPRVDGYGPNSRYDQFRPVGNDWGIIHPVPNIAPPLLPEEEGPPI